MWKGSGFSFAHVTCSLACSLAERLDLVLAVDLNFDDFEFGFDVVVDFVVDLDFGFDVAAVVVVDGGDDAVVVVDVDVVVAAYGPRSDPVREIRDRKASVWGSWKMDSPPLENRSQYRPTGCRKS